LLLSGKGYKFPRGFTMYFSQDITLVEFYRSQRSVENIGNFSFRHPLHQKKSHHPLLSRENVRRANSGRDADLLIVVNSQIPTNDLIVHFL